ncbi:DUF1559 domain-containing protein [Planctomicrobium sp. SH668]|uniref:DUF1559 domain-containing protein n=1 Tax=Planctomicrobium sp. SH668 TaxID=3448126 RepID=UPI003F5B29DF
MNARSELQRQSSHRSAGGFTILELLICVALVAVLLALVFPVLGTVRESSRRVQCSNHLKQIGLAIQGYHESFGYLPPAWRWHESRKTLFGWLPPLLPYLGQQEVFHQINFSKPLEHEEHSGLRELSLPMFTCPSDLMMNSFLLYSEPRNDDYSVDVPLVQLPSASYIGVFGVSEPDDVWNVQSGCGPFSSDQAVRIEDFAQGASSVILVGERRMSTIPSTWLGVDVRGEDAHCRILGNLNLGPNVPNADECEFTSRHPGCANFLWADGHVAAISNKIDRLVYQQLAGNLARKVY